VIAEDLSRLLALDLEPDVPEDVESVEMNLLQVIVAENVQTEAAGVEHVGVSIVDSHVDTSFVARFLARIIHERFRQTWKNSRDAKLNNPR
jgi:hypothetical protein